MILSKLTKSIKNNKLLTAILIAAVLLRFVGIFPNIPHPDESPISVTSWTLAKNILVSGDFNPHSYKYGSVVFYLQALGAIPIFILVFITKGRGVDLSPDSLSLTAFYEDTVRKFGDVLTIVGRSEIAIFGALSVFVVYLIGKKLFNRRVGLISALLLAVAPMHVRDSHYMITDVLFIFTILLGILFSIYFIEKRSWRWSFFSGLVIGISSTIRYFPLAFLIYPIVVVLSFQKKKEWLLKIAVSAAAILLGIFIGIPNLFLDPQGPALMLKDLVFHALPWYGTGLSNTLISSTLSLIAGTQLKIPEMTSLYPAPESFRPLFASWIFFNGIGPLPAIFALGGMIILFLKSFKKFLLLAIIPIATLIYISLYIPAIYPKLSLPTLPFLAVFAAVFVERLVIYVRKRWGKKSALGVIGVLLLLGIYPQLFKTIQADISCSQKRVQQQSAEWVDEKFPNDVKVGYLTMVSIPSTKKLSLWTPLEPIDNLSLEEARLQGADYAFLNAGRLDYETYPYFNDFFVVPSELYENSYPFLTLLEYQSRATLLNRIRKPLMCDSVRIYYYQLPSIEEEAKEKMIGFDFNDPEGVNTWRVQNYGYEKGQISFTEQTGRTGGGGSLLYTQEGVKYTPPRIRSSKIPVEGGKLYTFSFLAKSDSINQGRIVGRVDYYDRELTLREEIANTIQDAKSLLDNGSTPVFFEKRNEKLLLYGDPDLPGRAVFLSPRNVLDNKWKKIKVLSKSPEGASYAIFSIQNTNIEPTSFQIDDVNVLSSAKINGK